MSIPFDVHVLHRLELSDLSRSAHSMVAFSFLGYWTQADVCQM